MLGYLGAPIAVDDLQLARAAGLVSFVLLIANLLAFWLVGKAPRQRSGSLLAWVGLVLFALGCAVITGMGRVDDNEGQASRYHAFSVLWWIASIVVASATVVRLVETIRTRVYRRRCWGLLGANVAILLLVSAGLVRSNVEGFRQGMRWQDEQRQNQQCILAYESASDDCLRLFGSREKVRRGAAYLAERRLAIFRDGNRFEAPRPAPSTPSSSPVASPEEGGRQGREGRVRARSTPPGVGVPADEKRDRQD